EATAEFAAMSLAVTSITYWRPSKSKPWRRAWSMTWNVKSTFANPPNEFGPPVVVMLVIGPDGWTVPYSSTTWKASDDALTPETELDATPVNVTVTNLPLGGQRTLGLTVLIVIVGAVRSMAIMMECAAIASESSESVDQYCTW